MKKMEEMLLSLSPQQMREIYDIVDRHIRATGGMNMTDAVTYLYKQADKAIEESPDDVKKSWSCKKGCAHCCHIRVVATNAEAAVAVKYAKEHNIEIDKDRLEKQQDLDVEEYMFSPHKRCVFLGDDNTCKIYPVRPMSCRTYYVTSPADMCDTDKYPHGHVAGYINLDSAMPGAALMHLSSIGNFAKLLIDNLK